MAKISLTQMQKYAIVLIVAAAALLFLAPLLLQPQQQDKLVDPSVFYSAFDSSSSAAIIANISGAQTDAAKTAILQCSVDLRSNIISSAGKNTIYVACDSQSCLYSDSNDGNSTKPASLSQISPIIGAMPQFYISYGEQIAPAYYKNKAYFWVNDTLPFSCSVYSVENQQPLLGLNSTSPANSTSQASQQEQAQQENQGASNSNETSG